MPKTLAFGVGQVESRFNFEKCLANSRVWYDWRFVPIRPRHFKNGNANLPWNVPRKRGCGDSVNKWAKGQNIGRKVARNAFSVGFEAAGYPVFETGPGLMVRETQLSQLSIYPNGEGQLNQSSIVV